MDKDDPQGLDRAGEQDARASLVATGEALAQAIAERMAGFVEGCVLEKVRGAFGAVDDTQAAAASTTGRRAVEELVGPLRALLGADVDEQATTPLSVLRRATGFATEELRRLGVPPAGRERFAEERFPDDIYGLTPASMAVLGEEVEELAIRWGAAKAMAHRRRHLRPRTERRGGL